MSGMKEVHIVVTLAIDPQRPSILYAGTTGGAYRSTNGGATWTKINNGLIPAEILDASLALGVNTLVIDPQHTNTIYAGTTKGLFKSSNMGNLWMRIAETMTDQYVSSAIIDPQDTRILYIGSRAGIQKSTDGGHTWTIMNAGLESTNVRTMAMSPTNSHILYTGTNGSGLYYSETSAERWKPIPLTAKTLQ
jgi:photosystem II stability/assembly factor-like uncharacterized protein